MISEKKENETFNEPKRNEIGKGIYFKAFFIIILVIDIFFILF